MAFDWYPLNPIEFRRDTYHLSAAEDGIYRRLIDEYMIAQAPLPDNDRALAAIARVGLEEWTDCADIVRRFFQAKDGKLFHKRCEQELDAQRMLHARRSHIAKEAATVRWSKEKRNQSDECLVHTGSNASAMLPDATRQDKTNITYAPAVAAPIQAIRKRPQDCTKADIEAAHARKRQA